VASQPLSSAADPASAASASGASQRERGEKDMLLSSRA
jgi:hypothetical protein